MTAGGHLADPRRREAIRIAIAAGGGLLVGIALPGPGRAARSLDTAGDWVPNAFVRMNRQGEVTLSMHKVEMGQGVFTSMTQLIAEELGIDPARVRLEHAAPDDARYGDPFFGGEQVTGGSTSIRGAFMPLRQAGAIVREWLVAAAARFWLVDPARLQVFDGTIVDSVSRRRIRFGDLVEIAATLPAPTAARLAEPEDLRIIGRPLRRLDGPGKVDGSAIFGIDVQRPGMKIAAVAASPVLGGKLDGIDRDSARRVPRVHAVIALEDAVAVIADNYWSATQGLAAAVPSWHDGIHSALDTAAVQAHLDAAATSSGALAGATGDAPAALRAASHRHHAAYRSPFLAHAALEPLTCVVHVRPDGLDLWVGTQVPTRARMVAARIAGVTPERVHIHNQLIGGAFGRRLETDWIEQAVRIGMQIDGPVKVVWSRAEDIQQDRYRPCYLDQLSAGLGADGMPVAWIHRIAGASILARFLPPAFKDGVDSDAVDGAVETPYTLPATRVEYVRADPPGVPTAFWRGVGPTHNAFVVEGFLDELAAHGGRDPLDYRRALVREPRARVVLDRAAMMAGWGGALPSGQGRGIALLHAFGSYIAQVARVSVDGAGDVRVLSVSCAIDCGQVVNPLTVAAQIEGGIIFGLSAALWGEITLANGRIQQSNFHDYRVMRMGEAPAIDVHIVPSHAPPGGVGEPGTSAAIPAVANAIHAATGRRIRTLPVGDQLRENVQLTAPSGP